MTFDYQKHYAIDAERFDYFEERPPVVAHSERRLAEWILSKVPKNAKSVLDVGCGRAWVAAALCPKGVSVCSMDIAPKNVEKALARYPFANHAGVVGDGFNLPFEDESFDCVIASEVIEHVPNPEAFAQSLFRVVKKGGALIVSTPYKEKIRYELCVHCHQLTPVNAHLHSFDERRLLNLCRGSDLEKVEWWAFNNKALLFLRTYVALQYLPFPLWRVLDRAANLLLNKPANVVARYLKKPL
ncbi:MAG: class I SAM-dependent methyltransferase [Chloroherpetonaceae bacterium]|nr:class I SAM-dependent methyltransferase [Chloroherpetonaceae bacterium]MDW8436994.1 class I SAM-dependent methyltransferase [Chloroherpetonaceae bacterium]